MNYEMAADWLQSHEDYCGFSTWEQVEDYNRWIEMSGFDFDYNPEDWDEVLSIDMRPVIIYLFDNGYLN